MFLKNSAKGKKMSFQKTVNINPPLGVVGTFASIGVSHTALAGVEQFVAGTAGVVISRFAWCDTIDGTVQNAKPTDTTNWVNAFIERDTNIAVIGYQGQYSMTIPVGFPVSAYDRGDFFVVSTTAATVGQKVFASDTDGTLATGAAGATVAGFTETNFTVAKSGAVGVVIKITAQ